MKERPILFSGPMVRAILEGRKTQTRRVVKWPKSYQSHELEDAVKALNRSVSGSIGRPGPCDGLRNRFSCPYGVPGDRLWVRETWYGERDGGNGIPCVAYAAEGIEKPEGCRWRPSIHMPRWACRLVLEIVSVRVERLQDITEEDAIKEGVEIKQDARIAAHVAKDSAARMEFWHLWSSIYGPESWNLNPNVSVVEFRNVEDKR